MNFRKWKVLTAVVLSCLIIAGFVVNYKDLVKNSVDEELILQTIQEDAIAKQKELIEEKEKAEAKKLEEEKIQKEKAEAEAKAALKAKQEQILANTFYVELGGAPLLEAPLNDAKVLGTLPSKKAVFAVDKILNATGEIEFLKVKENIDAIEDLGYIAYDSVKEQLSDFIAKPIEDVDYSPFAKSVDFKNNPKIDVKGIYVTGNSASGSRLDELIQLIDETELNAVVVDVKDDNGFLLFKSEAALKYNPQAYSHYYIEDMKAFVEKLKAHDIYTIARIVTFKSPIYAEMNPDRAIVYKDSQKLYSDADGLTWASPHDRTLWAYNIAIAKEAAAYGFDEIQFDYVRFPAIANQDAMDFKNPTGESQSAAIQNFLKTAYLELSPLEVYISADVFGWAASALSDVGIGQHWESVSNVVDYICPMMYPSHYGPGNYGLDVPDAYPYETIDRSVKDAISRNANLNTPGGIRPWIQDFTATWVNGHIRYRAPEVRAQIDALKANGINEYLVWNAGNFYSKGAFK